MHIDKDLWYGLSLEQQVAIRRAAREAVVESHAATESIQCQRLNDTLNINSDIDQLNIDGSVKRKHGETVSAQMTMTRWPEEDLKELQASTAVYLESLANLSEAFATVYGAMRRFADPEIPISPRDLGPFPDENCTVALVS